MDNIRQLQQRLRQLTEEMGRLGPMRRGTLNEQFYEKTPKGEEGPVLQGPYYVLSRKVKGKTVSRRVPRKEVEQVRREMQQYERFVELSREFVDCSEQLGMLLRETDCQDATQKKTPKSPSRRTRK
jgi:hypothetical protein